MAIIQYKLTGAGNVRSYIDPKTQKLLVGLSAIGINYCRIQSKGITVLPTRKKKMALEVITTLEPQYFRLLREKKYHGFRCGEYQADKTGELLILKLYQP